MIRILLADDHAIVRNGLKQIIAGASDLQVIGEAASGAEVLELARRTPPDLLLLDMTMPGISGAELIRRLRADHPNIPVLVLSMHNEAQVVSRALKAGASGYVTKDSDQEILLAGIRKVAAGNRYIDPALVDAMVFDGNAAADAAPHAALTERELQVLEMLASGQSLTAIAESLHLSAKTISAHKAHLMQKLGIDNNADLMRYAIRHGLTRE
ncbi:MAG TPA: response regulator transcription factor [Gallionellaceae bacterium]